MREAGAMQSRGSASPGQCASCNPASFFYFFFSSSLSQNIHTQAPVESEKSVFALVCPFGMLPLPLKSSPAGCIAVTPCCDEWRRVYKNVKPLPLP